MRRKSEIMSKAVKFEQYGGIDVLQVVDVERPAPGPGQVLVNVKAAGINPGEAAIRKGLLADRWPATFPSGQGSDLAGVVVAVGEGVQGFAVGDEVIGFTHKRASHAEFVVVEASNLIHRPRSISWEAAGSLFIAGTTAYAAVRAVSPKQGYTIVVSGAAGGVGSIVVQLAVREGAKVIGLASPTHHQWLSNHGVIPVAYGEGVEESIRAVADDHLDACIDTFGADYVELALKLGVRPERIDTIINFEAATKYGVKAEGTAHAASAAVLADLAQLIDQGELEIPIARVYPLADVREAYRELEQRHTLGKIVLVP
jgi:NADPH:quinone reductase-like Zn-dependent oxidoreductase